LKEIARLKTILKISRIFIAERLPLLFVFLVLLQHRVYLVVYELFRRAEGHIHFPNSLVRVSLDLYVFVTASQQVEAAVEKLDKFINDRDSLERMAENSQRAEKAERTRALTLPQPLGVEVDEAHLWMWENATNTLRRF